MLNYALICTLPMATSVLAHVCRKVRVAALLMVLAGLVASLWAAAGAFPDVGASEIQLSFDPFSRLAYSALVVLVVLGSVYAWLAGEDDLAPAIGLAMAGFLGLAFSLSKDLLSSSLVFEFAALFGVLGIGLRSARKIGESLVDRPLAMRYISYVVVAGVCLIGAFTLATRFEVTREVAIHHLAFALLSLSLLIALAAFPVNFWLPKTLRRGGLMSVALVVSTLSVGGVWLFVRAYQTYPWLMTDQNTIRALMVIATMGTLATSLMALAQRRLDRIVAYSVSSNAGAVVVGVASGASGGTVGGIFVLLNYLLAVFLMMVCLDIAYSEGDELASESNLADAGFTPGERVADLGSPSGPSGELLCGAPVRHVFRRTPITILALSVGGIALAGTPLTGAFVGRWMVYEASASQSGYLTLSLIASSALVFLAYARFLGGVLLSSAPSPEGVAEAAGPTAMVLLLAILLLAAGVYPAPILQAISEAIGSMPHL